MITTLTGTNNFLIGQKLSQLTSKFAKQYGQYGVFPDPDEYPRLSMGPDSKRSFIAKAVFSREGVKKASFLPVLIDKLSRPEVLSHGDPRFDDALKFMDWVSEGYDHKFTVEGDEVVVTG